ncbi:MAG: hypothetical protein IAE93_14790 [Ignavibacteria bacterium]|nr:hypothetical protein [Ignavibacteria bacterium]
MGKFNKDLHDDITHLKELHALKDKTAFKKRKAEVMKRHEISRATVYREMKKDIPGYQTDPNYNPPIRKITEKEKELVRGLLFKQVQIEFIRPAMEKKTGKCYSWDRINKIREAIEDEMAREQKKKSFRPKACEKEKEEESDGPGEQVNKGNAAVDKRNDMLPGSKLQVNGMSGEKYEYESPHGEDMKVFLGRVLGIEEMDPRTFIRVPVRGYTIKLGYDAVKNIQRYAANSAAGGGYDIVEIAKMNLKHLYSEQIRLFANGQTHTTRELKEFKSALGDYSAESGSNMDFEFVLEVALRFAKKGVTRDDVAVFAYGLAKSKPGISEMIIPSLIEVSEAIYDQMKENS